MSSATCAPRWPESPRSALLGLPEPSISVGLRTGDTPAEERRIMARRPPDVLITTPESLFLMLTSATRSILADVESVIVDEVHAIAGSKRGAHLAVSLARLDHLVGHRVPRIGLSATVRPTDVAARFLGGDAAVEVIEQGTSKKWELTVQVPVEDLGELSTAPSADGSPSASIWPHVEGRIVDLVEAHRSTIVFANSRRLAERLTARLNEIHAERAGLDPTGADRRVPLRRSWPRRAQPRGPRRFWPARITARSARSSARSSRRISSPAGCGQSSPRRASSSASTWARWTS